MRFAKTLASAMVVLLIMAAFALAFTAEAQSNTRTQLNLGIKKSDNPSSTTASGDSDFALPSIVRVGETHFVNGRLVKIEGKSSLSGLANAEVKLIDV